MQGSELFPKIRDIHPHHSDFRFAVIPPDFFQEAFRGDQAPGIGHEQLHHLKLLVGQPEGAGGGGEDKGCPVQGDVSQLEQGVRLNRLGSGHGPDTGQQLPGVEGLGEIIVGPGIQPQHLVVNFGFGGEKQHGNPASPAAQLTEHRDTVFYGHHDIQNHPIVVVGLQIRQCGLPVKNRIHRIVVPLQYGSQGLGKSLLILCQ